MDSKAQTGFEALLMTAFVILLIILIASQAFKEQDITTAILIAKNNTALLFADQNRAYVVKTIEWKNYGIISNANTLGLNIVTDPSDIYRNNTNTPYEISIHPKLQEWIDATESKIEGSTHFSKTIININRALPNVPN